jgi:LCP family protein required for cell wall assembly
VPQDFEDGVDRSRQIPQGNRPGSRAPRSQAPDPADGDVIRVDTRRSTARPIPTRKIRTDRPSPAPAGPGGPTGPSGTGGGGGRPPRRHRKLRLTLTIVVLVLIAWIGSLVWAGTSAWNHVAKVAAEPLSKDRPAQGSGRNYLLVGSDSREGLTKAQKKEYTTGNAAGGRTDSIMLVHLPDSGDPTLVSIPRDSYVPIRRYQDNKINAAFSFGGPSLLIDTVEQTTGLRIDGYIQVGFAGFSGVVDSLGGVRMCLPHPMNDKKAGINLPKGCQVLNGKNALGYVRARYSDPLGDLGRVQRQRQFLGALMSKAASPANVLLPWRLHRIGSAGAKGLTIDKNDSPWEVAKVLLAVRKVSQGHGQSLTIPLSDVNLQTHAGSAVKWDHDKALALFKALRTDQPLSVQP